MLRLNERQKKTLKYLATATVFSWVSLFPGQFYPIFGFLWIFVPLTFGLALHYSNKGYLRNQSSIVIPFLFILVHFLGTLPFYSLNRLLEIESSFFDYVFGCMSAFMLVLFVTKLTLKNIQIGYPQILMTIILPLLCISILYLIFNSLPSSRESFSEPLLLLYQNVVLFYQSFMTIIIVSSMKEVTVAKESTNSKFEHKTSAPNRVDGPTSVS